MVTPPSGTWQGGTVGTSRPDRCHGHRQPSSLPAFTALELGVADPEERVVLLHLEVLRQVPREIPGNPARPKVEGIQAGTEETKKEMQQQM